MVRYLQTQTITLSLTSFFILPENLNINGYKLF